MVLCCQCFDRRLLSVTQTEQLVCCL
jgi:hypothetical protein